MPAKKKSTFAKTVSRVVRRKKVEETPKATSSLKKPHSPEEWAARQK